MMDKNASYPRLTICAELGKVLQKSGLTVYMMAKLFDIPLGRCYGYIGGAFTPREANIAELEKVLFTLQRLIDDGSLPAPKDISRRRLRQYIQAKIAALPD